MGTEGNTVSDTLLNEEGNMESNEHLHSMGEEGAMAPPLSGFAETGEIDEQFTAINTIEQAKQFILGKSSSWIYRLGLERWEVLFDFDYMPLPISVEPTPFPVVMTVEVCWPIRQCIIRVNMEQVIGRIYDNTEKDILHELIHVMINEMRADLYSSKPTPNSCACEHDHEERVVTDLTSVIWNIHREKEHRIRWGSDLWDEWQKDRQVFIGKNVDLEVEVCRLRNKLSMYVSTEEVNNTEIES